MAFVKSLVKCPSAFRLRRLAYKAGVLGFGQGILPVNFYTKLLF